MKINVIKTKIKNKKHFSNIAYNVLVVKTSSKNIKNLFEKTC